MLLPLLVGLIMFLAVYGGLCYWSAAVLSRKKRRLNGVFLLLSLCLLWVPSLVICFFMASLIPLTWGHAGELVVLSAVVGAIIVWIGVLGRFGEMVSGGDGS